MCEVDRQTQLKMQYEPAREPLLHIGSAGAITLDFPASRPVLNKCQVCKTHPVYGVVLSQTELMHVITLDLLVALST